MAQPPDAGDYGPRVIVILRAEWVDEQPDNYDLAERVEKHLSALGADTSRLESDAAAVDRRVSQRLTQLMPARTFEQLLGRDRHERLRARLQAAGRPFRLRYFVKIACPDGVEPMQVAALLKQLSFVEDAYVAPEATDPAIGLCPTTVVAAPQDALFGLQDYLAPAPLGIDALCVREHWPGAPASHPGAGVTVADVEQGWKLNHEDLPPGIPYQGTNYQKSWAHGTAVLGVICAVPNTKGVVGIAPGVQVKAVSHRLREPADAIVDAYLSLNAGDILLIEAHVTTPLTFDPSPGLIPPGPELRGDIPLPAEARAAERIAIKDAVATGVVVIEAAGNGGVNLDTVFDSDGTPAFDEDTGAIIVAAAHGGVPHARMKASNVGSIVSCYALGEDVATCWFDEKDASVLYTTNFRNTSAAAAIIAGAAAAVQSFALERTGAVLDPSALRERLIKGGTPSALPGVDLIGVMPDLRQTLIAFCDSPGVGRPELIRPEKIETWPPGPPEPPDPLDPLRKLRGLK
jgi:serine protease